MLRKTTTALALAGALTFVVAGCGGNDDTADANDTSSDEEATPAAADAAQPGSGAAGTAGFCQNAKALYDQLSAAPADPTSPQVQDVFAEAKSLEAPEEIATDWNAILDNLVAPVVNGEIDVNDPAGTAELTSRAAGLAESLQRTGTYFDTACGFGAATTVTTAAAAPTPTTVAPAPAPAG